MNRRVLISFAAAFTLVACGGSSGAVPQPRENQDPHAGWIKVDSKTSYRCIGDDKLIRFDDYGADPQISAVKASSDCVKSAGLGR